MTREFTAGEFATLTGLSPKALRLYHERGILLPAFVEPGTGYRYYDRAQVGPAQRLDLLRRASVPLSDLKEPFDFQARREHIALRRYTEDFYLDVAEEVSRFDPAQFRTHVVQAPEIAWVGLLWRIGIPAGAEEQIGAFAVLSADLPLISSAFQEALTASGFGPSDISWTAVPETPTAANARTLEMVITRPVARPLEADEGGRLAQDVRHRCGQHLTVLSGTLPRRFEVTFTPLEQGQLSLVQEAALDYKRHLAFENYLEQHQATPIGRYPRPVEQAENEHATVFDVRLD